jgi:hypothetical protein
MDIAFAVIAGLAVLGLIALGIVQQVLASREREQLHRMIKSRDLSEYVSVVEEPKEEKEEIEMEVPIDEIPFLNEEESRE